MEPAERNSPRPHRMTRLELQRRLMALRESKPHLFRSARERELENVVGELELYRLELEAQNRELIESRRALEGAHRRYQELYDSAPISYVTLDRTGVILDINLAGASLIGLERPRLLGRSLIGWIPEADRPRFRDHLARLGAAGASEIAHLSLTTEGGSILPVQLQTACAEEHFTGRLLLRVAIADLTEQHHLVERLESERLLRERFVSELSHDLRSPLAAARIGIQLILADPSAAESNRVRGSHVLKSLDRMGRMIRDLLDANRIQAGQFLHLDIAECDLSALTRATVEELVIMYGDRIRIVSQEGIWGFWDAKGLRRALENLVSNAVKYGNPEGPITVTLKERHKWAILAVHNEGEAIAPKDQATLFSQFRRTSTARQSGHEGWGLGLTLVRGVAEAHGGTASVQSAPGEGTTFSVRVPLDSRDRANLAP